MTNRFDIVLFDIDNVLVDTRRSYLAAIRETVARYLGRPNAVSARDVDRFKLLGGFNDDWDTCYGIITFLETAIQGKPVRYGDHRRQRIFISELPDIFPERPLGLEGLLKHLRILYERVETPSYKKIAQIFQEVYLGRGKKPGLIRKEKLIFPKSVLEKLVRGGLRLGIVTGRDKFEADYALKRFGIRKFFKVMVTIDDVRRAEKKTGKILRKPDPWPILEAAKQSSQTAAKQSSQTAAKQSSQTAAKQSSQTAARRFRDGSRRTPGPAKRKGEPSLCFLYVGDLPDDVLAGTRAAKKIRIQSAAFPTYSHDPKTTLEELKKVRPDFIFRKPGDLFSILSLQSS